MIGPLAEAQYPWKESAAVEVCVLRKVSVRGPSRDFLPPDKNTHTHTHTPLGLRGNPPETLLPLQSSL